MHIYQERIDDIPLIIAYLAKKNISSLVDINFKNHGNQNSLSNGEVLLVWLAYILSEGDHRKSHVQDWVRSRQKTLNACLLKEVDVNNFTDDRLTRLLYRLSNDASWKMFENALAKETLSLIPLEMALEPYFEKQASEVIKGTFKIDGTSISGSHEVTQDGLMQFGFSKDHRPDLPQVKIMYCSEGVCGAPLMTLIDSGNINDDFMYEPILDRMRSAFNTQQFLYCGDCKMSIHKIRTNIVKNKEFYLCPLQMSNSQVRATFNEEWVKKALNESGKLIPIEDGEEHYGYGYELTRNVESPNDSLKWEERVLIVKSIKHYEGEKKKFNKNIDKITEVILKLKTKFCKTKEEAIKDLEKKIEELKIKTSLPAEFFKIETEIEEFYTTYKRHEIRNGKERIGTYKLKRYRGFIKNIQINEGILKECLDQIGWRAYITNIPKEILSFSGAYKYYRKTQYVIEDGFHLLKSKPTGIKPLNVFREDQIKGLMRLMTLGVLIYKLISLEVSINLKKNKEVLQGLTAGQPSRKTERPSATSIFNYFYRSCLTLTCVEMCGKWQCATTLLPELCRKILTLMGLGEDVYLSLAMKAKEMTLG